MLCRVWTCQATLQNLSGHLQDTFGNSTGKPQRETPKGNPLLLHKNCQETHQKPLRATPRYPWDFYRETPKGNPKGNPKLFLRNCQAIPQNPLRKHPRHLWKIFGILQRETLRENLFKPLMTAREPQNPPRRSLRRPSRQSRYLFVRTLTAQYPFIKYTIRYII